MKPAKLVWIATSFSVLTIALISMSACGGGGNDVEKPDVASLLKSGQWKVQTVTVNGTNQLSVYTGLTITFSDPTFTSTNGEPVWPASGTWTLNSDGTIITRDDGLTVNVGENISESSLTLSLAWSETTLGGGRSESVAGNHTFTFGK